MTVPKNLLQVKLLEGAASGPSVAAFLGRAVEPPVEAAVRNALRCVQQQLRM